MTKHTQTPSLAWISTAIPYVNAPPHLGYALEAVVADAIARYRRQSGWRVHSQAGTDDNSLKNARAAEALGLATQTLVDENAQHFEALKTQLDLAWDAFVRTSNNPVHRETVNWLWRRCRQAGDIYLRDYQGRYCVGCEQFYSESELSDDRCPEHGTPLELVRERNYFFRLSRYQARLAALLESRRLRIVPEERHNEVVAFVTGGLADFSVSRSRERANGWGLGVPDDPAQVIYVWFDALANYLTGGGLKWWSRATRVSHVIGKGILRFHAVYWPALLLSAGFRLPDEILVHGYLTVEGRKIGKSLGNAIDPSGLVTQFGVDAVRYYLLRHVHTTKDGDFSRERLERAYASELADQLGNLVQRCIALVLRYADGRVPESKAPTSAELALGEQFERARHAVARAIDGFALHEALAAIWRLVAAGNRYVDQNEPWQLAKGGAAERAALERVLYHLGDLVFRLAQLLAPFLPATACEIARRFDGEKSPAPGVRLIPGSRVVAGPPLFPKAGPSAFGQKPANRRAKGAGECSKQSSGDST